MAARDEVDWHELGLDLTNPYVAVQLDVDGYLIELSMFVFRGRPVIGLEIRGEKPATSYASEDCEERRRFFHPYKRSIYTRKLAIELRRSMGAAWVKQMQSKHSMTSYRPWWPSLTALRRHLIKRNTSIRRIS